jgi:hypothetical protein
MREFMKRLTRRRGHKNPVPDGKARLVTLDDYSWLTYSGRRAWCDTKPRPCRTCGGSCCPCRHTERKPGGAS